MSFATGARDLLRLLPVLVPLGLLAAACEPAADEPGAMTDAATMDDGTDGMTDDSMDGTTDDSMDGTTDDSMDGMTDDGMDGTTDDGMAGMGTGADISVAAETGLDALPDGPLAWVAYRVDDSADPDASRSWGPALLFADDDARTLDVAGGEVRLEPGEAVFVDEGQEHTVPDGGLWAFLLTDPDAAPPAGLDEASREFDSGTLQGLPAGAAEVRFLIVDLPPGGGQTTVHRHPGPEFVHVTEGEIEYETGLAETTVLTVGDEAALPRETAVQKRNPSEETARFWSWFIVDPDEPFAPEATFDRS